MRILETNRCRYCGFSEDTQYYVNDEADNKGFEYTEPELYGTCPSCGKTMVSVSEAMDVPSSKFWNNLFFDTLFCIKEHGAELNEIVWLGTDEFRISWENFEKLAMKTWDIHPDFKIVGEDWVMVREYYGDDDEFAGWRFIKTGVAREIRSVKKLGGKTRFCDIINMK